MNFIKRWIAKIAHDESSRIETARTTNKLQDMLSHHTPSIVAFRIANGYLVLTRHPESMLDAEYGSGFFFCADHQAVADHIVASAMKEKLGVQGELFAHPRKKITITARTNPQTAGAVGSSTDHYPPSIFNQGVST